VRTSAWGVKTTSPAVNSPARPRALGNARGFTLLEIVVVMAIIAVAVMIAVPAVQAGRHQREVRATLQRFVGAVREASSKAVLRRRTVELWVSPDERAYALALPKDQPQGEGNELDDERDHLRDRDRDRERDRERELEDDEQRTIVARVSLPESASFGEIRGGRLLEREVYAFPFFPTGGSGGGAIEFVFENGSNKQSYTITFDPLISSVDLAGEDDS